MAGAPLAASGQLLGAAIFELAFALAGVHVMTEAHQTNLGFAGLDAIDEALVVPAVRLDRFQHLDHALVGATVPWTPQATDRRRQRREQIGLARTDHAHGRGAAVLLVIG